MRKEVTEALEDVFGCGSVYVVPYLLMPETFLKDGGKLMDMGHAYFKDGVSVTFGRYAVQRHGSGVTLEILALPVIIRGTGKKDFPKELADCHLSDIPECVVIFMDEFPAKGIPKAAQSLIRPEVGVHIEDVVNRCVASPESARASIANPTLVSYKDYGCFVHMIALRLLKVYRISNPDKKSPGIFGKTPFWA